MWANRLPEGVTNTTPGYTLAMNRPEDIKLEPYLPYYHRLSPTPQQRDIPPQTNPIQAVTYDSTGQVTTEGGKKQRGRKKGSKSKVVVSNSESANTWVITTSEVGANIDTTTLFTMPGLEEHQPYNVYTQETYDPYGLYQLQNVFGSSDEPQPAVPDLEVTGNEHQLSPPTELPKKQSKKRGRPSKQKEEEDPTDFSTKRIKKSTKAKNDEEGRITFMNLFKEAQRSGYLD